MNSLPTATPAQLQPVPRSTRPADPSPEQPIRSADEVLADWRALSFGPQPECRGTRPADYRAFYQASADAAERRSELLTQAGRLPQVPQEIAQYLIGWVATDLLTHAERMREAADRQRVDDGGEQW